MAFAVGGIAVASHIRYILSVGCLAAALYATLMARHGLFKKEGRQLSISSTGVISIEDASVEQLTSVVTTSGLSRRRYVELLPTSTLWSGLLILNLRDEQGNVETLIIFSAELSEAQFHKLAVACIWIASQIKQLEVKNLETNIDSWQ